MTTVTAPEQVTFVIIGSGFSGLGAAVTLLRGGHRALGILEGAADVGGTWRDNVYPGCRCDVQSNLYSYSFALKPDWSESFPSQPELWEYLRQVPAQHGLARSLRSAHEVTSARWDDQAASWRIATTGGDFEAQYLIAGVGSL